MHKKLEELVTVATHVLEDLARSRGQSRFWDGFGHELGQALEHGLGRHVSDVAMAIENLADAIRERD